MEATPWRARISFRALAGASLLSLPLYAQPAAPVVRTVLDNGLTVLLQEDHASPLVTVAMMYRAGARNEAAGATGLAHYVEHMNFRATRAFPGHEVTDAITRIGGRWSGYTWIDQTYYAETIPSQAFERMLELEADRMTSALYDPAEFQLERTSVIAELHSYADPKSVLYDAVLAASFEIHPYRNNTIGWLSDVKTVTRDDAYRFYRRFYHPRNAVLAIVGDVDATSALRTVGERFDPIPAAGDSSEVRTVEPLQTGQRRVVVRRPGPHAMVMLAFRAPALAEPDFAAMVLLDALLAGGKGAYFTRDYAVPAGTLLRRATLGAGLASAAETDWQASLYPYVYTLAASAPSERDLPALEPALFQLLEQAATRAWSDDDFRAALRQIRTGLALDLDDQASRAHQLAFFEVSGGYEHLFALPERIARVTREDLARFVRERLQPHQATVGWFVPTSATLPARAPALPTTPVSAPPPPAIPAASRPPAAPAPRTIALTLGNRLRAILAPRAGSGLVALRGRIEAGSRYDPEGLAGLSALATEWLASVRLGEPSGFPGVQWTLHESPASVTNLHFIEFAAAGLAEDVPALLEALAGRLTREAPSGDGWTSALHAVRERCREWNASSDTELWRRALAELFPAGTPAASPSWGDEDAFDAADPRDLQGFLAAHVMPSRTTLVLTGDLDVAAAQRLLSATLGRWKPPGVAAPRARMRPWPEPRGPGAWRSVALARPDKAQNDIRIVWPGDRSEPWDRAATETLLYLLGETGYAGRLGRALVEPGLVYAVYATLEEEATTGFLMVRTAAAPKDTPEVLRRIRAIIEEAARGGFTQQEVDEARTYLRGKAAREKEGTARLAATLIERPQAAAAKPASLTLARLNDTARRLFRRGSPVALVAGPGE